MLTVPVRQITHATPRTRLLALDLRAVQFPFAAGQAVMLGLSGSPLRKPYSIASAPWEVTKSGIMQLLVQVEDSGGLDPHLELASPGTPLDLDGPFGTFGLPVDYTDLPLLFVAGGTGIAPLRSMLMERLSRPGAPRIALVYSVRTPEEFAYRSELDAMATAGRISLFLTVSRQGESWDGRRGRIDQALLQSALPSNDACCLICGPPELVRNSFAFLSELNVSADRILTEKY